jgi:hypothetical protein
MCVNRLGQIQGLLNSGNDIVDIVSIDEDQVAGFAHAAFGNKVYHCPSLSFRLLQEL